MTAKEYFDKFGNLAIVTTIGSNLFPSVKLAMSAIESNYGKSYLATDGNNYFGIKSQTNPNNFDVIIADDDLPNEGFRKYKSIYEGWADATAFLVSENPRYETAIKQTSPGAQIDEIMKAGYATAQYADLAKQVIDENNLTQYDKKKDMDNKIIIVGGTLMLLFSVWFMFNFVKPTFQNS
jgi:flagellum-specific peptidoglycan hydrolase FlgJ